MFHAHIMICTDNIYKSTDCFDLSTYPDVAFMPGTAFCFALLAGLSAGTQAGLAAARLGRHSY
jgi:hypothetical protein